VVLQAAENFASTTFGQIVAGVIVGVVLGFPVFVVRWGNKHVAKPLQKIEPLVAKVDRIDTRLINVEAQFHNNAGHSMRDQSDRNERLNIAMADKMGIDSAEVGSPPDDYQRQ
jgi:hypothetical protein